MAPGNIDGAFWYLFARDRAMLSRVRAHLRPLEADGFYCELALHE